MPIKRAISIRQPYVEQIFRRTKKFEYRVVGTRIRERVWIYASLKPEPTPSEWRKVRKEPGELASGAIVGSVEIVDCIQRGPDDYAYKLAAPKRLARHKHAKNHPQPIFWIPKF